MSKKCALVMLLFIAVMIPASAQFFGTVANDKAEEDTIVDEARGFSAQVKIETNLFQFTNTFFSDAKERHERMNSSLVDNYPFGGFTLFNDSNVAFGYNGDWFGGNITLNKNDVVSGLKAWIGFLDNKIKISAGNDIGYSYADSQGADAGLRVYDDNTRTNNNRLHDDDDQVVDSSKNPDNITQDSGILLEFDFAPVKVAVAGGGNFSDVTKSMGSFLPASNFDPMYGLTLQYGVNVGSKITDIAKINAAYIFQFNKAANKYEYNSNADKIVATSPDAEVNHHLFGVYGSLYPFSNDTLGVTLGYAGTYEKYLDEFSVNSVTAIPYVFKNGLNLTARYMKDGLTIKTDHNYSFWTDKNYKIYYSYKPDAQRMQDYGLLAESNASSDVSDVSHSLLWNGIGVSYRFTELFEGSLYTRNLLRIDETEEYKMTIDYYSVEVKGIFRFSPSVEAYASVVYQFTGRAASESLAGALDEFPGSNAVPKATNDSVNMFKIPIGITVKLQK